MLKKVLTYILLSAMLAGGNMSVSAADASPAPKATATATATPAASAKATATASAKASATATAKATASAKATATAAASASPTATPGTTPAPSAEPEAEVKFPDVDENSINAAAITGLAKMKVINGYEDGTFKPDNAVSRAEFVKMLVVLAGWDNI